MADFLHGVELVEVASGLRPVRIVRGAVVGLVGIAPIGPIETPTLIYNETLAAQFGKQVPGFTIPQALAAILKQGGATVIVINVFDPATMTVEVADEVHTTASGKFALSFAPVGGTIVVKSNDGLTTYIAGTDYKFDEFGTVTILNLSSIPNGTVLKTTYDKLDATAVTSADIIGAVSAGGVRTGMKALYDSFRLFGFNPKILIAPGYSQLAAVATEMDSISGDLFARGLVDMAAGTTTAQAIAARGTSGAAFNTASKRIVPLFPAVRVTNTRTNETETQPYSPFFAGVWCKTILELGYHYSPSNKAIAGIVGAEQPVSFNPLAAAGTDANELNAVGITTLGNNFGQGFVAWGNRSAAYPTSTAPDNFLSVLLTADIIDESVMQASLVFVDEPINFALIDSVRETVNAFLRSLIARGALVDGINEDGRSTGCYFDAEKNPDIEIAAGHITFTLVYMPPTPAERITYDRFIDIQFLRSLTTA